MDTINNENKEIDELLEVTKDVDEVRKAFVISEILTRKY